MDDDGDVQMTDDDIPDSKLFMTRELFQIFLPKELQMNFENTGVSE